MRAYTFWSKRHRKQCSTNTQSYIDTFFRRLPLCQHNVTARHYNFCGGWNPARDRQFPDQKVSKKQAKQTLKVQQNYEADKEELLFKVKLVMVHHWLQILSLNLLMEVLQLEGALKLISTDEELGYVMSNHMPNWTNVNLGLGTVRI